VINEQGSASKEIKELSSIFSQLDSLNNLIGAFLMNGIGLYHLHVYRKLLIWKKEHAKKVKAWLDVIGEFESLSSLANFAFNNPDFCFPGISSNDGMFFKDLGHPLLDKQACVRNTVTFDQQEFIILTGSNMSGKSTFLRTLGVNMVLGSIGAPICASEASIQARKVWVSMRVSDSLEDSESYFFAEVKRLKEIMDHCEKEASFVLLDEILRGTNSDDKRSGTIEVIKKLITKDVMGAIATHDLEVCLTTDEYPDKLINQCFEVEIINNELYFDYKLRPGICKNKSATFLMEKMGVI
jgi:DNA mismatch repair ATPase MutS